LLHPGVRSWTQKNASRRARSVLGSCIYEYAIELYLLGLGLEAENVEVHQELRDLALERAAKGGKPMGLYDRFKTLQVLRQAGGDEKQKMLAAEELLAFEPGNQTLMLVLFEHAERSGSPRPRRGSNGSCDAARGLP
jgi:hypothetical protein